MKSLFKNLWFNIFAVTAVCFLTLAIFWVGLILWFAYFIGCANEMYNDWLNAQRKKMEGK
jgi:antibiotic biosynthesis monooxygenase (ABM) superfamily enzyme